MSRLQSDAPAEGAREATIRASFPLVRAVARRVLRVVPAADLDDLVGDGSIGLIRAVDTFDPARGTALESYARRLILGAMLNGLRRLDPVSERARRTLRVAEQRRYELAQECGTLPPIAELERADERLRRARTSAHRLNALSLDAPLPHDGAVLVDWGTDPARRADERDKQRRLREALALLPERQRRILAWHYYEDLSLHAIGARMKVSAQRVSQLHRSALARLRVALPGL